MKHQEPQFQEAAAREPRLKLLLSVFIEPQRDYRPELGRLDISLQKTWSFKRKWRHESGFSDIINVHFPYDTFFQLQRLKPEVVVSYELGARSIFAALYRLLHRRSRLILAINVSEHTEKSWSRLRVLMRRVLLRCADIVTYQGSSGKRYLQSLGVPETKLKHNPYVAHPKMLYPGPTERGSETRRKLLFVGQFTERKAPLLFLKSLGDWCNRHPDRVVEISMVGRGPLQSAIEQNAYPKNLIVNMIGSVDPINLSKVYRGHGVMVFPTLADEWGLVVDEALHSGLPVLSSVYAQATLDLIEEGKNGWRFTPDDSVDAQHAIDRLMATDESTLNRMAAYGRESVAHRTPEFGGGELIQAIQAAKES
jgi:glycosyltransferase involved in cell wall biosynthesis